jgi:hypothetical protein
MGTGNGNDGASHVDSMHLLRQPDEGTIGGKYYYYIEFSTSIYTTSCTSHCLVEYLKAIHETRSEE